MGIKVIIEVVLVVRMGMVTGLVVKGTSVADKGKVIEEASVADKGKVIEEALDTSKGIEVA